MPDPKGVLPLYEPEGFLLQVDAGGKGFYDRQANQGSDGGIPKASLSGPSTVSMATGLGGTVPPGPGKLAKRGQAQRALTPEELMAAADRMSAQFAFEPGPSAVEPTLERDTGVPYWLRNYADKEGFDR